MFVEGDQRTGPRWSVTEAATATAARHHKQRTYDDQTPAHRPKWTATDSGDDLTGGSAPPRTVAFSLRTAASSHEGEVGQRGLGARATQLRAAHGDVVRLGRDDAGLRETFGGARSVDH